MAIMNVRVNGVDRTTRPGTTIVDLVASLGHDPTLPGVAVAVDGQVLTRAEWDRTVHDGAAVEVVTAVQGGS